jgi:hypothetical protein
MRTTYGAEELGLCSRLPAKPARGAATVGLCLGYGIIWKIRTNKGRQKYSARLVTLSHNEILTIFLCVNLGALQMRVALLDYMCRASEPGDTRAS